MFQSLDLTHKEDGKLCVARAPLQAGPLQHLSTFPSLGSLSHSRPSLPLPPTERDGEVIIYLGTSQAENTQTLCLGSKTLPSLQSAQTWGQMAGQWTAGQGG